MAYRSIDQPARPAGEELGQDEADCYVQSRVSFCGPGGSDCEPAFQIG